MNEYFPSESTDKNWKILNYDLQMKTWFDNFKDLDLLITVCFLEEITQFSNFPEKTTHCWQYYKENLEKQKWLCNESKKT